MRPAVPLGNNALREIVWKRDKRRCVQCNASVPLHGFICEQIDRRRHRKVKNLRCVCSAHARRD